MVRVAAACADASRSAEAIAGESIGALARGEGLLLASSSALTLDASVARRALLRVSLSIAAAGAARSPSSSQPPPLPLRASLGSFGAASSGADGRARDAALPAPRIALPAAQQT